MKSAFKIILLLATVVAGTLLFAQQPQRTKRLILRDGSYQPAIRWEIKGDRVRFFSADRFDWEEMPKSLIDWAATDAYTKKIESGETDENARAADAEEEAERKAEEDKTPTVAPGLRLPMLGGVYMLDVYRDQPQLVEMVQSGGEINKEMGRNILRAAINPLASAKQSIELKGTRARVQAHGPRPALYVSIDDQGPDPRDHSPNNPPPALTPQQRFRIVKATEKKNARVIGNLKIAIYGKVKQEASFVPADVQVMTGGWYKVTPAEDLAPGEYALVELLNEKELNLYVWDFGVDPSAPMNDSAWKPVQPPESRTGTNESPVLRNRKQKDQ